MKNGNAPTRPSSFMVETLLRDCHFEVQKEVVSFYYYRDKENFGFLLEQLLLKVDARNIELLLYLLALLPWEEQHYLDLENVFRHIVKLQGEMPLSLELGILIFYSKRSKELKGLYQFIIDLKDDKAIKHFMGLFAEDKQNDSSSAALLDSSSVPNAGRLRPILNALTSLEKEKWRLYSVWQNIQEKNNVGEAEVTDVLVALVRDMEIGDAGTSSGEAFVATAV